MYRNNISHLGCIQKTKDKCSTLGKNLRISPSNSKSTYVLNSKKLNYRNKLTKSLPTVHSGRDTRPETASRWLANWRCPHKTHCTYSVAGQVGGELFMTYLKCKIFQRSYEIAPFLLTTLPNSSKTEWQWGGRYSEKL